MSKTIAMQKSSAVTILIDHHANRIIALATSLLLALFCSFLLVLAAASNAHAQQATGQATCGGTDLIAKYEKTDPELLAKLRQQAEATPNGHAVFWKIEKEGIKPSFLLGTMHMADERIARLEGARLAAFEQSKTVIVENIEALDPQKAMAAMLENRSLTFYTDGTTLEKKLDAETITKLKVAAEQRGMPWQVASVMQPWLVATAVALPVCEMAAKQNGKPVLDSLIAAKAQSEGKQLIGLETIKEQFSALAGLPENFHLAALKETLAMGDLAIDVMETMKMLYARGEIGMVLPLTQNVSPITSGSKDYQNFQDRLITDRNGIMAERALPFLEKGNAFMAVGALHLPGDLGLVEAFKKAGYTVTVAD